MGIMQRSTLPEPLTLLLQTTKLCTWKTASCGASRACVGGAVETEESAFRLQWPWSKRGGGTL